MKWLLSPTEHSLKALLGQKAITSSLPEKLGADIVMFTKLGRIGIQRKMMPNDFLASVEDGRLSKEIAQLSQVSYPILLCEGLPHYNSEGRLFDNLRWTKQQIRNLLRSVWYMQNIYVEYTLDIEDTIHALHEIDSWFNKREHVSLLTRPKATAKTPWGTPDRSKLDIFLLQGFPGVGAVLAKAMLDYFGRVPLRWDCTPQELLQVPGIGEGRLKELWQTLSTNTK